MKIDSIEFAHTTKGLLVAERPVIELDPIENRPDLDEHDEEDSEGSEADDLDPAEEIEPKCSS